MQFLALLVQTDHRAQRVIGPGIDIQHVLHLGNKASTGFGNAPALYAPRLDFVFFSAWWTATCEMSSTTSSRINSSRSIRIVQRALPVGGSEQASKSRFASTSPVILGTCPGLGLSRSADFPSRTKRRQVRDTVTGQTPTASAICACVFQSGWFRSASSRMRARVISRAFADAAAGHLFQSGALFLRKSDVQFLAHAARIPSQARYFKTSLTED